jgi:hypothetical protein
MPEGYYLVYAAQVDAPYWRYIGAGMSPAVKHPDGVIPQGALVYLQRPPDTLGTHQSAYLMGVGRIIVRLGHFHPAPPLTTDC